MRVKLKDDWFYLAVDPSIMHEAGIYQWLIEGVGVYVGKAKVLRHRVRAYPNNVRKMIEGRPWHGNPKRDYREIHKALRKAYDNGTRITVTVLETCDPADRADCERRWIDIRRGEESRGGLRCLI